MPDRLSTLLRLVERTGELKFFRARSFNHELFAKHFQQSRHGLGFTSLDDGVLRFGYRVPEEACLDGGTLPLSAIISLADDVTTWASIARDRAKRPGVSISLEATLLRERPPSAGDELLFEASVQKIGRTVGFLSCDVIDTATGAPVARAQHTKMLDMGRAWSAAFSAPLFPLTERVLSALGTAADRPRYEPRGGGDASTLKRLLVLDGGRKAGDDPGRGQPGDGDVSGAIATAPNGSASGRVVCEEGHLQEAHLMHGGAQAMLHETIGRAGAGARADKSQPLQLRAMRVLYYAGAQLGDTLELRATSTPAPWLGSGRAGGILASTQLSRVPGTRGGGVRSEATLEYVVGGENTR